MEKRIKEILLNKNSSLTSALKQMDEVNRKLLIVINEDNTFFSLISIGDIQRAIIKNIPLESPVYNFVRNDIIVANVKDDLIKVKERMKIRRNEFMPVVDEKNHVVRVVFWEDIFEELRSTVQINLPVVIMAGGRGSRLKPLTNIIPKPLIPIHDKTILEDIMDRFVGHGCHKFYISVNYKADMIRYYFDTIKNSAYNISYFQEDKPLGTAGSLSLLQDEIDQTFFVSNCDIIIDEDYAEILRYHRENKNEITLVAAIKHYSIPYGTLETTENGLLIGLKEKPELTFKINSGMYIIEPHVLKEIPKNKFFHITELIEKIMDRRGKVGVFPVSENSWKDMGGLSEYKFQ